MTEPAIFGAHEAKTLAQLRDVASRAERVALMADGHLGYVMPIGGVAAYRNQVSIVGVGFDIGCGNAAIRTNRRVGHAGAGAGQALGRPGPRAGGAAVARSAARARLLAANAARRRVRLRRAGVGGPQGHGVARR